MTISVPTSDSFIELARADNATGRSLRVKILCTGFVMTDPQALVDALAKLFPDVKPSPRKPKVGDWVQERIAEGLKPAPVGLLIAEGEILGIVRFGSGNEGALWLDKLTVIERGES